MERDIINTEAEAFMTWIYLATCLVYWQTFRLFCTCFRYLLKLKSSIFFKSPFFSSSIIFRFLHPKEINSWMKRQKKTTKSHNSDSSGLNILLCSLLWSTSKYGLQKQGISLINIKAEHLICYRFYVSSRALIRVDFALVFSCFRCGWKRTRKSIKASLRMQ